MALIFDAMLNKLNVKQEQTLQKSEEQETKKDFSRIVFDKVVKFTFTEDLMSDEESNKNDRRTRQRLNRAFRKYSSRELEMKGKPSDSKPPSID